MENKDYKAPAKPGKMFNFNIPRYDFKTRKPYRVNVKGYYAGSLWGKDFVIHKDGYTWTLSEYSSGGKVKDFDTKKECIEYLKNGLNKIIDKEKLYKAAEAFIKTYETVNVMPIPPDIKGAYQGLDK